MTIAPNEAEEAFTGVLRGDLELFAGEADENGQNTWVVFDPVADRYFRVSEKEHHIIGHFNGRKTVAEVAETLSHAGIDVSKEEVVAVAHFLTQSSLLLPAYSSTEKRLNLLKNMKRKALPSKVAGSYLFLRIPLWKPDRFLSRTAPFIRAIFNRWMILLLALISLVGYMQLIVRWNEVAATVLASFNFAGATRYFLTIVVLKLFHEFAHAYAAKSLGIRVRRMGLAFIVFFPRLYTDVTDSWRIRDRRKRLTIDAAGIVCELLIGGFAAMAWANTGPGLPNRIAYYVFAVSVISTVLVNGNPFIRYDGYYLLMDLTGIDNLQRRGIGGTVAFLRKYLWGIDTPSSPGSGWKKGFLIFYGFAAFTYRIFLYTAIILIVYYKFTKVVGMALMVLEVYLLLLKPLINEIRTVSKMKSMIRKRNCLLSILSFSCVLLVLMIPLPWNIVMPGEVRPEEFYMVRAQSGGFVTHVCANGHTEVTEGMCLLSQRNPFLEWEEKRTSLEVELAETELDQLQGASETIAYSRAKEKQLEGLRGALADIRRRKSLLSLASPVSGLFVCYDRDLREGKWLKTGDAVGEVYKPGKARIYAYAMSADVRELAPGDKVKFTINGELGECAGSVLSVSVVADKRFSSPSPLLSSFGGPLEVMSQRSPLEPGKAYYQVIIRPDRSTMPVGRTGVVRIRKYSSVAARLLRKVLDVSQKELSF